MRGHPKMVKYLEQGCMQKVNLATTRVVRIIINRTTDKVDDTVI